MPKKSFQYQNFADIKDIWYTPSLTNWFIVKEDNSYTLRKGTIIDSTTLELGNKRYKSYLRLGDAKVGLENYCKEVVGCIQQQKKLFDELQKRRFNEDFDIDREVERLKNKWGVK